jgi:hypothetical protein
MDGVVKFPYRPRVGARKPRRSKNGTPEERAAKGAAANSTTADVLEISGRSSDDNERLIRRAAVVDPEIIKFLQCLRDHIVQEFAEGKDIDQIFRSMIARA